MLRPFCQGLFSTYLRRSQPCLIRRRFLVTTPTHRPMAFYSLAPLTKQRVMQLKHSMEKNLNALGVLGRIYLAPDEGIGGINCQMSVPLARMDQVKNYFKSLESDFGKIEYTQGVEDTARPSFEKLRILTKKNLVATKHDIKSNELLNQPEYLTPEQWHKELKEKKEKAFLIDMRNQYEYNLGHFMNAIKMKVDTFRDGVYLLDELVENRDKEDDIYMYCTGGIRCSVVGPYLKNKGYQHVKMLKGGISAYGEYIKNQKEHSLFKGKNFVFDSRRIESITDDVLAKCFQCGSVCDHLVNCENNLCHLLFVQCDQCKSKKSTCSSHCQNVIQGIEEYKYDYDYHKQVQGVQSNGDHEPITFI
ncbi:hypothetical protein G6F23_000667 [Rhizopus arrhizus]|nr:hypothetical protein G6F23_000667 [Rhizopus arrhizus]